MKLTKELKIILIDILRNNSISEIQAKTLNDVFVKTGLIKNELTPEQIDKLIDKL